MSGGLNGLVYLPNELASHVPWPYFVRLLNFVHTPLNAMRSRKGFEPIRYYISPAATSTNNIYKGLVSPSFDATLDVDYYLNGIDTINTQLFGDALVFTGPNASSLNILPFTLDQNGKSQLYTYNSTDVNGNAAVGDERGGFWNYFGKLVFWNGRGTCQYFANAISESLFTQLDNSILPLEDQTIIGAATFEQRLVVVTLEGYMMWSQPQWDGVSIWQDSTGNAINYLRITEDPGELIQLIQVYRGGIIISTRNSARVSGRVYNVPTLDPTTISKIDTGINSYFSKNAIITSGEKIVGITPQGVLTVEYDSLARGSKTDFAESQPIQEYLVEIFQDNTIYNYLAAFFDPTARQGYYITDWNTDATRTSKIIFYDYSSEKWAFIESDLVIQKMFIYYGQPAAAGWKRYGNKLVLCIWAMSELDHDLDLEVVTENISSTDYYFWDEEVDTPFKKKFVSGVWNAAGNDPNAVPGSNKQSRQILISSNTKSQYKCGVRSFSMDSWGGNVQNYYNTFIGESVKNTELWSLTGAGIFGNWNTTLWNHTFYNRLSIPTNNANLYYQLLFESSENSRFFIHSLTSTSGGKS